MTTLDLSIHTRSTRPTQNPGLWPPRHTCMRSPVRQKSEKVTFFWSHVGGTQNSFCWQVRARAVPSRLWSVRPPQPPVPRAQKVQFRPYRFENLKLTDPCQLLTFQRHCSSPRLTIWTIFSRRTLDMVQVDWTGLDHCPIWARLTPC